MKLFKKKEEKKSCCCGGDCTTETIKVAEESKKEAGIKILGSGCIKCNELENAIRLALQEKGIEIKIEHVTDFTQIAAYGVMSTPALVINGKVVSYGKVLKKDEVIKILDDVLA